MAEIGEMQGIILFDRPIHIIVKTKQGPTEVRFQWKFLKGTLLIQFLIIRKDRFIFHHKYRIKKSYQFSSVLQQIFF